MRRVSAHGRRGAVPLEPQSDELCIPVLTDEQKSRIQAMKPMTKEEWDARQSVIRRVVDPETGRTRYDPWGKGRRVVRLSILGGKGVLEDAVPRHCATTRGPRSPSAAKT